MPDQPHRIAFCVFLLFWLGLFETSVAEEALVSPGRGQQDEAVQHSPTDRDLRIQVARSKFHRASEFYETLRPLATRGAVSKSQLSKAWLQLRIAELELDSLVAPDRKPANGVAMAKVRLDYASERLEVSNRLWASHSVSRLQHRRTTYNYRFASLTHQAASGEVDPAEADLVIAQLKAELAKTEFDLATKLYDRRSISKSTYDALRNRMLETEADHQQHLSKKRAKRKRDANRLRT